MENLGASVVISHQILNGKQQYYEEWLDEIVPFAKHSKGFIDWQIIKPIPNLTFIYTIIIRFDTIENLKEWIESDKREKLIEKVTPLFKKSDNYKIKYGLDFLFEDNAKSPSKWKQFIVTWSAIYPLSILSPLLLIPFLKFLKIPQNHYISGIFISGFIVFMMVFIIMPRYTKLIKKWFFK